MNISGVLLIQNIDTERINDKYSDSSVCRRLNQSLVYVVVVETIPNNHQPLGAGEVRSELLMTPSEQRILADLDGLVAADDQ